LRSAREALKRLPAEIEPPAHAPGEYDIVILGTPVWAGHLASPLRAYLSLRRPEFPRVAFFCTQGGSGAPKVFREMADLAGKAPIATLVLNDRDIQRRTYATALDGFARAITLPKAA
jgi:hypothetical protein